MTSQHETGPAAVITRFATPIYLIAALCIIVPPLDQILNLQSVQPGAVQWRFGVIGMLTGIVVFPLAGLLAAVVTAVVCGDRWIYRVLMFGTAFGVLGLTVALGIFTLDAVQLRGSIPAELLRRYDVTVAKSILLQIAQVVTLTILLLIGIRARRMAGWTSREHAGAGLLVPNIRTR